MMLGSCSDSFATLWSSNNHFFVYISFLLGAHLALEVGHLRAHGGSEERAAHFRALVVNGEDRLQREHPHHRPRGPPHLKPTNSVTLLVIFGHFRSHKYGLRMRGLVAFTHHRRCRRHVAHPHQLRLVVGRVEQRRAAHQGPRAVALHLLMQNRPSEGSPVGAGGQESTSELLEVCSINLSAPVKHVHRREHDILGVDSRRTRCHPRGGPGPRQAGASRTPPPALAAVPPAARTAPLVSGCDNTGM
eukprot:421778-Prorocentrum_minimum.AAC.2